jgi:hypothetical protein
VGWRARHCVTMTHRRTWAFATGLLAGYCGLAGATGVAVAIGGTRRPGLALAVLAVAALLLATRTRAAATVSVGVMAWLFYAGFITGRHGDLAWHGMADAWRLGMLVASAAAGWLFSWLAARTHRDAARTHRDAARTHRDAVTTSRDAAHIHQDAARVISLAEARASRHA